MEKKNYKMWKNRGFNELQPDIFKDVTSLTELTQSPFTKVKELNIGENTMVVKGKQSALDDFNDNDKVTGKNLVLWNYKEQKEVIGRIVAIEKGLYSDRQITVETGDGELVIPSLTALESNFKKAVVGDRVKVVYHGEVKSQKTGRSYADFDVYIKHD